MKMLMRNIQNYLRSARLNFMNEKKIKQNKTNSLHLVSAIVIALN